MSWSTMAVLRKRWKHERRRSWPRLKCRPADITTAQRRFTLEPLEQRVLFNTDPIVLFAPSPIDVNDEMAVQVNISPNSQLSGVGGGFVPSGVDTSSVSPLDTIGSSSQVAAAPTSNLVPFGADTGDTSEFMIGDVHVTVVLVESDGSIDPNTEDWTESEIESVKSEITAGLDWWENVFDLQGSKHDLNFDIDFTYADSPVSTGYEPITRTQSEESLWIDNFLDQVGYNTSSSVFEDLDQWHHDQRIAHGTDWAYTVFVVDSSSDQDGRFAKGFFAYAYRGGPFAVMTYDNGSWGISRMDRVFAHETGHIFYALDEFAGTSSYFTKAGYLSIQNINAVDGHPDPDSRTDSIMAEASRLIAAWNSNVSSLSSLQMIGWRDSDGNGIFDILDVPLTLSGSGSYDAITHTYQFSGIGSVNTIPSQNSQGAGHDITLNTVDRLQYRLNGEPWTDGLFLSGHVVEIEQNVEVIDPGTHTIEFRAIFDETGLSSNIWSDTFVVEPGIVASPTSGLRTSEFGETAIFLVGLATKPLEDVTINLASSNVAEGTIDVSSLRFTPANWDIPQAVTITGMDDAISDGDVEYVIFTSAAVSGDVSYDGLDVDDVSVVNTDNEEAPFLIQFDFGTVLSPLAEDFERISSFSEYEVSVGYGWADGIIREAVIASGSATTRDLNITEDGTFLVDVPSNGRYKVTLTMGDRLSSAHDLMGVVLEGVQVDTVNTLTRPSVTRSYVTTIADGQLNLRLQDLGGVDPDVVIQAMAVERIAAIAIRPTSERDTSESGQFVTLEVELKSQPTAEVTLSLASSDPAEGVLVESKLVFSPNNWNVPQVVTVIGVDDALVDGNKAYTIVTAVAVSDDPDYHGLNAEDVVLVNVDNEVSEYEVQYDFGTVNSPLASGYQRVTSSSQYESVIGYGWIAGDVQGLVSGSGTATTRDLNVTADGTFVVDVPADGRYEIALTLGHGRMHAHDQMGIFLEGSQVDTVDTLTRSSVTETYLVTVVDGQLTVRLQDQGGIDPHVAIQAISVAWVAGIAIAPTSLTTSEAGDVAILEVALTNEPTTDVTISLSSDDPTEGTVDRPTLLFTPGNWFIPQVVTVQGKDDAVDDGDVVFILGVPLVVSDDPHFHDLSVEGVVLVNVDNEVSEYEVQYDFGTVNSPLASGYQRVTSSSQYESVIGYGWIAGDVQGLVSGSGTATTRDLNVTADGTFVVDVPADGRYEIALTLGHGRMHAHDQMGIFLEGSQVDTVDTLTRSSVTETYLVTVVDGQLTVRLQDQGGIDPHVAIQAISVAWVAGIAIAPTSLTTSEAGDVAILEVALTNEPTTDVTISLSSDDPTEGTVDRPTLLFTPDNWFIPQVVTVQGKDDAVDDGDVAYSIVTRAAVSADVKYHDLNIDDVLLVNANDDFDPGIRVLAAGELVTTEASDSAIFDVVLNSQPAANVRIPIESGDTTEGMASVSSLLFSVENWNVPQTVTVTGVDDAVIDGNSTYTINLGPVVSSDSDYHGLIFKGLLATNLDNDSVDSAGLIGHWSFDEGLGTIAADTSSSAINHNGVLKNGAEWSTSGQINGAVFLDGVNDYVDLGTLDVTGSELTLSAWVHADTLSHRSEVGIISKAIDQEEQGHYFSISIFTQDRSTGLRFRLKTDVLTTTLNAFPDTLMEVEDDWIHVVALYDGSLMRLYLGGVEVGRIQKTGDISANDLASVWVGGRSPIAEVGPWRGVIDDVRIYNRALNPAEIDFLAQGQIPNS